VNGEVKRLPQGAADERPLACPPSPLNHRFVQSQRWQWCFVHPEIFVVPIEAISPDGLSAEFAAELQQRRGASPAWLELLDAALGSYWRRATDLHQRAPRQWLPPRAQHLCIVARGHSVRPYFQPIRHASWLLCEDDFDPDTSSVELATYLLFHMERMGWCGEVVAAFEENLSYWITRNVDELEDFRAGAKRSTRPDALAFRALADHLDWICRAHHPLFRPPTLALPGGWLQLGRSGVLVPRQYGRTYESLQQQWVASARKAVERHERVFARKSRAAGRALCDWVASQKPRVLVLGKEHEVLWDPETPNNIRRLQARILQLAPPVAESIARDLAVIDFHSQRFLAAVRAPLPERVDGVDASGLAFLCSDRPLIAYRLLEPGMQRLRLPAPPYERLMLGARTAHEWGHLASVAGWVAVAKERSEEWQSACAELVEIGEQVVRDAPSGLVRALSDEIERLGANGSVGRGLAEIVLARMPDYQANLVARAFLSPLELETYVRNNVTCLAQVMRPTAVFQRLFRHAYEFQYLALAGIDDAWAYLCASTWFDREFIHSGVVKASLCEALFACVGRLCALQAIDSAKLLPAPQHGQVGIGEINLFAGSGGEEV